MIFRIKYMSFRQKNDRLTFLYSDDFLIYKIQPLKPVGPEVGS